ncbi:MULTISPECIES: MarR family winged helix-turn-helix transcriptional regulator [Catenuloplanes]|uniref:DNA-binding MarR family transcriptional regulator n=1 Tax=Catenuloplanes niger TaxID=587534 RepID=A0AAE4A188_9ACTN|nr:MarR family transcriptional regulator [Catenuloplanes niger]MDR7327728.1 DNA-binding MarR family transcriptional regulator [Catenuloplanes niger]
MEESAERVLAAMRAWGVAFNEFGRRFGRTAGLHVTDAEALVLVVAAEDRGTPLTQSALSRRIGLTSGATSSLLNRLEEAGHIERHRDRADRRMVTLRSTEAVHRQVDEFFAALGTELAAGMSRYDRETLDRFARLVQDMTAIMEQRLTPAEPAARDPR